MNTTQEEQHTNKARFFDAAHTKPATLDDAQLGKQLMWPLHDYHVMHCLYQWRRLHLAIIENRHIDEHVYSYGHTLHCTRLIKDWRDELLHGSNRSTYSEFGECFPRPNGVSSA